MPRKKNPNPAKTFPKPFIEAFFCKEKTTPNTSIGIASSEIWNFNPNTATNQAVAVVPILAPNINPKPPERLIRPALIKEIVITETNELDWMKAVTIAPTPMLLYNLCVAFFKRFCNGPLVKTLKPSSNMIIPNNKIAIPEPITLKLEFTNNITANIPKKTKKKNLLNILPAISYCSLTQLN